MSISMVSPSLTRPMGPPEAASGLTWPMAAPRDAPEKRPSVMRATVVSSFMPASARGGVEHLAHAGAALGAFVADDHHVAGVDLACVDGGNGGVLAVEHAGRAGVDLHFGRNGAALDHAAVRARCCPTESAGRRSWSRGCRWERMALSLQDLRHPGCSRPGSCR